MESYQVVWSVNYDADSPKEAVEAALSAARDATVDMTFTVISPGGGTHTISSRELGWR